MRAIAQYHFLIGTRIPFTDWPGIVENFFAHRNLDYRDFYYCFSDFDTVAQHTTNYAPQYSEKKTACHKAVKDFPQLSPIRRSVSKNGIVTCYLSNIEEESPCTQADLLAMLPKLYRKYGFVDSYLIYQDVDFFGRSLPKIHRPSQEPPESIFGSSVLLYRSRFDTRWNGIIVNADFVYGDETLDASIYRNTMADLLPGIRCLESVKTILTPEDDALFAERNAAAKPAVEIAQSFFTEKLPKNDFPDTGTPVATILKRLCKEYGYSYKYDYYVHTMRKRSKSGHYAQLEVDAYSGGGGTSRIYLYIHYLGLGFDHRFFSGSAPGMDQAGTAKFFKMVFHTLAEAEETLFPNIEAFYPPTPEWYVP